MSNHFYMGAINKLTNDYEYPKIADRNNKYKCPNCEKDVIFRKGQIKQPHFAHYKSESPCYYYDKPSESQIHKDAKLLMKKLLDNKTYISINIRCKYCENRHCPCDKGYDYDLSSDDYNENTKAVIEYKFNHNNSLRSADVAFLENEKIKCIFEICYKNKTKDENRPEPWFEIKAEDLINNINSIENIDENGVIIDCIRDFKCEECIYYEQEEKKRWIEYQEKLKQQKIENEVRWKIRMENEKKDREKKITLQEEWLKNEKQRKEEEIKKHELCKCNIMICNICKCQNPKFEMVKLSNNLYCVGCNKWKCRC